VSRVRAAEARAAAASVLIADADDAAAAAIGRAVKVDPIKPQIKAPGTERVQLQKSEPLSIVAFRFNMRRYTSESATRCWTRMKRCSTPPLTLRKRLRARSQRSKLWGLRLPTPSRR